MDRKADIIGLNSLLAAHFAPLALEDLVVTRRDFPHWMRPDLQRGLEALFPGSSAAASTVRVCAMRIWHSGCPISPRPGMESSPVPPNIRTWTLEKSNRSAA